MCHFSPEMRTPVEGCGEGIEAFVERFLTLHYDAVRGWGGYMIPQK